MSDEPGGSMFDYDARPVTPQVVLVGRRASSLGYELRDFGKVGISSRRQLRDIDRDTHIAELS